MIFKRKWKVIDVQVKEQWTFKNTIATLAYTSRVTKRSRLSLADWPIFMAHDEVEYKLLINL